MFLLNDNVFCGLCIMQISEIFYITFEVHLAKYILSFNRSTQFSRSYYLDYNRFIHKCRYDNGLVFIILLLKPNI